MTMIDDNIFRMVARQRQFDGVSMMKILRELEAATEWAAEEWRRTFMQEDRYNELADRYNELASGE